MQKKVRDVFNNEVFSIPNYQRDYAWEKENLEDLWEDLLEALEAKNDSMGHFLGTIVVAKNPQDSGIYDIIDGQQRATTIFMLRYALNSKTKDPQRNINRHKDDNDEPRLRLIPQNQDFFKEILKQADSGKMNIDLKEKAQTDGQRRLYEVFSAIWDKTSTTEGEKAKELLDTLDEMVLMWLEEKDSGRAIRMFQTVNDRGVPLLLLDKLKSLLILYSNKYCEGTLDDEINERFGEIFRIIEQIRKSNVVSSLGDKDFAKEIETRIFNYHALGQENIGHYKHGADEAHKNLKDVLKNKIPKTELHKWLDDYSKDLLGFFKAFLAVAKLSDTNAEAFKLLYILKINPYFYSSLVRLQMNGCLDDEILRLFAVAEICFYGLGSTNDASAYKLYKSTESKDAFKKALQESIKKCSKGTFRSLQEAITGFDKQLWDKYFHYCFLTYRHENLDIAVLSKLLGEKTYSCSIEHIVSQNAPENGQLDGFGFENKEDYDSLKDTFGNLLILERSLNSKAQDAALAKKQDIYKDSEIPYNREFANREDFLSFNKCRIIKENEKFKEWAEKFFKEYL